MRKRDRKAAQTTEMATLVQQALQNNSTSSTQTSKSDKSSYVSLPKLKDGTDFETWYLKVVSLLTDPRFSNLYDNHCDDIVLDGTIDPEANSLLYRLVIGCLDSNIETLFLEKTSLRGDGVALVRDIRRTYQRLWTGLERNAKLREWINIKQQRNESITDFSIRVGRLSKQAVLNGYMPATNDIREKFVLGLRHHHFLDIQKRMDDLPISWSVPFHELATVAQAYLDNANYLDKSSDRQCSNQDSDNSSQVSHRQSKSAKDQHRQRAIHAAIMAGTFKVQDFIHQVPAGACVYHGTQHMDGPASCNNMLNTYKKAKEAGATNTPLNVQFSLINKTTQVLENHYQQRPAYNNQQRQHYNSMPQRPPQQTYHQTYHQQYQPRPPPGPATAHYSQYSQYSYPQQYSQPPQSFEPLPDFQLDEIHDAITALQNDPIPADAISSLTDNYTNNTGKPRYYASLTRKFISSYTSLNHNRHQNLKLLIDSGASHHMVNDSPYFTQLHPWNTSDSVVLADGKSSAPIKGSGTIVFKLSNGAIFHLNDVLYVPSLSDSLFSTKVFTNMKGCYFHSENSLSTLAFPSFILDTDDHPHENSVHINIQLCSPTEICEYTNNHWPQAYRVHKQIADPLSPIDDDSSDTSSTTDIVHPQGTPSTPHKSGGRSKTSSNALESPPPDTPSSTKSGGLETTATEPSPKLPSWVQHNIMVTFRPDNNHMFQQGKLVQINNNMFTIVIDPNQISKNVNLHRNDILHMLASQNFLKGRSHLITKKANEHIQQIRDEIASIS